MEDALADRYAGRPATELIGVDLGRFRERQPWAVAAHATRSCDLSPQFTLRLAVRTVRLSDLSAALEQQHTRRPVSERDATKATELDHGADLMMDNEELRLVLNIVAPSLAFWWGLREGRRANVLQVEGGKDG